MTKNGWATWIAVIGGVGGLLVGLASVVFINGEVKIINGLIALIVVFGFIYLFYAVFFKQSIKANRLKRTGLVGTAKILKVTDTGVTINQNPQVKLLLEVNGNSGNLYTTHCKMLVSRINPNSLRPGMVVPVKIDPKNELNVVVDFSGDSPLNNQKIEEVIDTTALKSELEQLQKENEAILAIGISARAIVKKYTWLGVHVNGNNPFVELELEVVPENTHSFGGKARGVIGFFAENKFQAGEEIMVKYDPNDNSRIAIFHS